ncbi:MAG: hypothetical protein WCQ54_05790 [Clostridiaceae bacterium]
MQIVYFVGEILLAVFILIVGYNYLSKYLFSKLKVNKWLVLAMGVLFYFIPTILTYFGINIFNSYYSFIFSIICGIFLLWFFDLQGWTKRTVREREAKKNDITIRPKAKPNRVKKDKK